MIYPRPIELLNCKTWLITGVAGFIGSHLLENLLMNNQLVVGIDNLITGNEENLYQVRKIVGEEKWCNFKFENINILDENRMSEVFSRNKFDYILHQAALGSVPRSINDPKNSNLNNVDGTLMIFEFARKNNIKKVVFASSSSVYGDIDSDFKIEEITGNLLSPYAVTKFTNELYSRVYNKVYNMQIIGLRYFNVFGPRQNPKGQYAAVIPLWINSFLNNEDVIVNGDGTTSRDFCYIENVVQANILAAIRDIDIETSFNCFNIAVGETTTLNRLIELINSNIKKNSIVSNSKIFFKNFRKGDILKSQANINYAKQKLGYSPKINAEKGIEITFNWYFTNMNYD